MRDHLKAGGTVCPYAHAAEARDALDYRTLRLETLFDPDDLGVLKGGLGHLMQNPACEGVLFHLPEATDHRQAMMQAHQALFSLKLVAQGLPPCPHGRAAVLEAFDRQHFPFLHLPWANVDPRHSFTKIPGTDDEVFSFAMNPLYPKGRHPRYAPSPVMVCTRWSDLVRAREHNLHATHGILTRANLMVDTLGREAGARLAAVREGYDQRFYAFGPTEWPLDEEGKPFQPVDPYAQYWE